MNHHFLDITASTQNAVENLRIDIRKKIETSQIQLHNHSRKIHSFIPTSSGAILTPSQVHKLGEPNLKKGTQKWKRQQDKIISVRENSDTYKLKKANRPKK